MNHVLHVHQAKLRKGEPALIDRTYKGVQHGRRIEIICSHGEVVAALVQPEQPDRCGARAWVETSCETRVSS